MLYNYYLKLLAFLTLFFITLWSWNNWFTISPVFFEYIFLNKFPLPSLPPEMFWELSPLFSLLSFISLLSYLELSNDNSFKCRGDKGSYNSLENFKISSIEADDLNPRLIFAI